MLSGRTAHVPLQSPPSSSPLDVGLHCLMLLRVTIRLHVELRHGFISLKQKAAEMKSMFLKEELRRHLKINVLLPWSRDSQRKNDAIYRVPKAGGYYEFQFLLSAVNIESKQYRKVKGDEKVKGHQVKKTGKKKLLIHPSILARATRAFYSGKRFS